MHGFHLSYAGSQLSLISKNHKITVNFPSVISDFISEGITYNRIAGPFSSPPFQHFISSSLGVVPKSEQGKYRVIEDLSFPKHNSVNDHIPQKNSSVQYESIDKLWLC